MIRKMVYEFETKDFDYSLANVASIYDLNEMALKPFTLIHINKTGAITTKLVDLLDNFEYDHNFFNKAKIVHYNKGLKIVVVKAIEESKEKENETKMS